MSFPNIPDIEPTIVLSREDTVNLLLSSIAMEEHALAQLIEAEKCKVLYVLNECRRRDTLLSDAVTINKSVNETIQNIIKLEMLLQFKLEHVKELVPHKATPTPAASHTPPCSPTECSTTERTRCCCRIFGRAEGSVLEKEDPFHSSAVCLKAALITEESGKNELIYEVRNRGSSLHMYASGCRIQIQCPSRAEPDRILIRGKAHLEGRQLPWKTVCDQVSFKLLLEKQGNRLHAFRMYIEIDPEKASAHDSGTVIVDQPCSDLRIDCFR